jgi:hypothetical protein
MKSFLRFFGPSSAPLPAPAEEMRIMNDCGCAQAGGEQPGPAGGLRLRWVLLGVLGSFAVALSVGLIAGSAAASTHPARANSAARRGAGAGPDAASAVVLCASTKGVVSYPGSGTCEAGTTKLSLAPQSEVTTLKGSVSTLQSQVSMLQSQVSTLQALLTGVTRGVVNGDETLTVSGENIQLVNGTGSETTPNGLGNLIIGYNDNPDNYAQSGSHNLIVGDDNSWSSYGGLLAGQNNAIGAPFASVTGGSTNSALGTEASVSGGFGNTASSTAASVSGGDISKAETSFGAWVGGGFQNTASGNDAAVSGGTGNLASGQYGSVSGGDANQAETNQAGWVGGGYGNTASGFEAAVSGGWENTAGAYYSSVSGGGSNSAGGNQSSVSGGDGNTTKVGWASILGGEDNTAGAQWASVLGGYDQNDTASCSTIPGGAAGGCH